MNNKLVEKSIEINASPDKVWQVFTDPAVSIQMGGLYVTDWKVGSSIGWKGPNNQMITNGTILQLEPDKLLQHDLLNDNANTVISVITYQLIANDKGTTLFAREELTDDVTDNEYEDILEGWNYALQTVKVIAEMI